MEFTEISSSKSTPKTVPKKTQTVFDVGDIVILKTKYNNYATDYKKINNKKLKITRCYIATLGKLEVAFVDIAYTDDTIKKLANPYVASHFEIFNKNG